MSYPNPQVAIRKPISLRMKCAALVAMFAALILSAPLAAEEASIPDAVPVFQCNFGENWDMNYDNWPDRWVRRTGPGYPQYVNIGIQDDAAVVGHKCLQIDLDGAAAAIVSPPIRVMSRFSYAFEAQLKNTGLKFSSVVITLEFCDAAGHVLQTEKSEPFGTTKGWMPVVIGRVEPRDPAINYVMIGLEVLRGSKGDLKGHVALADVTLRRLPRIDVATNNACNVYNDLGGVEVQCALSGIREQHPEIDFQLLDAANNELQREHFRLTGQRIIDDTRSETNSETKNDASASYECTTKWSPKIPDYGFYHVVVLMKSAAADKQHSSSAKQFGSRTVDLVVVPPLATPRRGEFGWTLPQGDRPFSFQDFSRLLPQVGINWVKVPLWFDAANPRRGDELIRFVELLGASNIDAVGIIDKPPNQKIIAGRQNHATSIADLLSQDSSTWAASLEPVMTRLSLRVRWWQLGADYDTSFASLPDLNKRIRDLRTALFRFGQDVRMGMSWDWANANAQTGKVTWDFQQQCQDKQPTSPQFEDLLKLPRANSAQRWVIVEPPRLPAAAAANSKAAFETRATEFVQRLLAAKVSGAEAIIVPRPFNDENGLMRANGMPTDMLLPWRTTATMLGGGQYLGQMQLPAGSENRIFLRGDGQVVMVVWNHSPTREVLYLGDHVQVIDLLGRAQDAIRRGHEQEIVVGPTPTFILGLHEAVTRWRMSAVFEKQQVPSINNKPHQNALHFKNFFPQGVGGQVKIVLPQDRSDASAAQLPPNPAGNVANQWTIEPPHGAFQLATGAETKFPFDIKLKDAWYGKQPVRVDFLVEADEKIEFSVYSAMEVGTEDLTLEIRSHLDKDGTLVIEQLMTNNAPHVADFKCTLRVKRRRPQRMQVYRLGKNVDRKVYRIPNGSDLVGEEMLVELEEVNGPRFLKYRFIAAADSPSSKEVNAPGRALKEKTEKSQPSTPSNATSKPSPLASAKN